MLVNVGKIVNMHGIKGEVKIMTASDFAAERFQPGNKLEIHLKNEVKELEIRSYRVHKQFHLVAFKDMNNINDVEQYKGHDVFQEVESIDIDLDENEFYYNDIIGCTVLNGEEEIGKVTDIFETGANDVWVVKGEKEHLIPYIEDVVKSVNIEEKVIHIEAMEGLLS